MSRRRAKLAAFSDARRRALRIFETEYVIDILQRSGGNVSEAARLGQLDRKHLWRLMLRNGITVEVDS
jgi:DNA-binding NtrC family response regulator